MSDMAGCDRAVTPLEQALSRLTDVRTRLDSVVSRVIEEHAVIQAQSEAPPEVKPIGPSPGSSDLVCKLSIEADEIDTQVDRLLAFINRSEVS
jgi:hypothetical protein